MNEQREAIQGAVDAALGDELQCPICEKPIEPGQRRVSWFTKNEDLEATERGAVHLACLTIRPAEASDTMPYETAERVR